MIRLPALVVVLSAAACSQRPSPPAPAAASGSSGPSGSLAPRSSSATVAPPSPALAAAHPCGNNDAGGGDAAGAPIACGRFASLEEAFRAVVSAERPLVLAVGEAHAQRGTDGIASSTKRFTEQLLPLVAPEASDVVVELWAPDPSCEKDVKKVAAAHKPITEAQAPTNQNEYVTLGTRAKALGMTPWLLRPTCDDFAMLADAGVSDRGVDDSLKLVRRLTGEKVARLYERNRAALADGGAGVARRSMVLTYGGALHNDLHPGPDEAAYSFGPDLDRLTGGRYVALDLIVPEYVKDTPTWQKLRWYAAWRAEPLDAKSALGPATTTLYALGPRSYVLLLPSH